MDGRVGRREEIMRASIVLVVVLLPLWASLARAQQRLTGSPVQSPPPSATAAAYPALNSQPFGTDHLLGDWGGARSWLESHGIDVGINYFSETAAIVSGRQRHGVDYTSQIGLSVDLEGEKLL